jgi:hypothetical protein
MENPGRSSRIRRHPARISRMGSPKLFGDERKLFEVSPSIVEVQNFN